MGIINQQGKFIGNRHLLDSALYLCRRKCRLNIRYRYFEMPANGNGTQSIVYAEPSGHRCFHIKVHQTGHMEINSQCSRLMHQLQIFSTEHTALSHAIGFHLTGMPFQHLFHMGIIPVYNTDSALPEQHSLAGSIFFKAFMLVWPDMVRLQIGENTVIK